MLLTPEQTAAMASLTDNDLDTARRVITGFNDLGQLIEDGFFPESTFYDKHQVLVLRSCHLVEPIRRHLEDESEGGNYGRTLLRMRMTAARYYDNSPKHDDVAAVYVSNSQGRRLVYQAKSGPLKRTRRAMARPFRER
jgi:hypothetical protein